MISNVVVVSLPPKSSNVHAPTSSRSLSPSSSRLTIAESKLPEGFARSFSIRPEKNAVNSLTPLMMRPSGAEPGFSENTIFPRSSAHGPNLRRSRPSTPRTAPITPAGIGWAKAPLSSTRLPSNASKAASTIARICDSMALIARGVNAAFTGSRRCVCNGGSLNVIQPLSSSTTF